jgi:hypothetical protein
LSDYEQARKWVLIRRSRFQTAGGFVSVFEAPDDLLQNERLSRLVFQSANEQWLEFVMNNRNHADFSHDYDLVAGPVANDRVYAALTLFEGGLLDFDETIRRLKTYQLIVCEGYIPRPLGRIKGMYPESNTLPKQHTSPFRARLLINQILFHTEKSLQELAFLRSGRI